MTGDRSPGLGPVPVHLDDYTRDPVTGRPGEPATVRTLYAARAAQPGTRTAWTPPTTQQRQRGQLTWTS